MVKDLRGGGRLYADGELVQEDGRWLGLPGDSERPAASAAAAAAISPARRAFPSTSSRLARSVAPAARRVQAREHERRHRTAAHAGRGGLGERLLDQRLDVVEALVGRAAEQEAAAAELPVRRGDRAPPRRPSRRAPRPAGRRAAA